MTDPELNHITIVKLYYHIYIVGKTCSNCVCDRMEKWSSHWSTLKGYIMEKWSSHWSTLKGSVYVYTGVFTCDVSLLLSQQLPSWWPVALCSGTRLPAGLGLSFTPFRLLSAPNVVVPVQSAASSSTPASQTFMVSVLLMSFTVTGSDILIRRTAYRESLYNTAVTGVLEMEKETDDGETLGFY